MKRTVAMKAIALSLGLAALTLPSATLNAQSNNGRGLFGKGMETDASHDGGLLRSSQGGGIGFNISTEQFGGSEGGGTGGFNISTEQFGNEGPLGSGLFIMAAAGAAYAFKKRKNKK